MAKTDAQTLKEERDEQQAQQEELTRRLVTKTHVPNKVPVLETPRHVPDKIHRAKVIEIYTNSTLLVEIEGKKQIISIPINRTPQPVAGDTVSIRAKGDYLSLAKPEVAEAKK